MSKFEQILNEAKKDETELEIEPEVDDAELGAEDDAEGKEDEDATELKVKDVKDFLKAASKKDTEACVKAADKRLEELGGEGEEGEEGAGDEEGENDKEDEFAELGENAFDRILKKYGIGTE